ncbi:metalloregulator ArsR/SmtB family transcription factor [Pelagibius sp. CAU 1746]|uniref:ArsR/SmtB family transcription factor n=1 Tax=Pelagibius sp. CAU 1746 TaxID=3140370 RepID=UPI00325B0B0E
MSFGSLLLTSGRASRLLRAMGNERRLIILCHLCDREHSVNELCRLVGLSQSALSQHLAKLRRDNLVKTRRSAQTVYYSVSSPEVAPILKALSEVFPSVAAAAANARNDGTSQHRPSGARTADARAAWRKSSA